MAAKLRLVVHAAQAQPLELAAQSSRDRLAQRRLSDAGGTDKAQNRRVGLRIQLHHGQVFEDPLLDVLKAVMILVEHAAGGGQVEVVGSRLIPGQFQDQFEMRSRHLEIGGGGRRRFESRQLALRLAPDLFGKLDFVHAACGAATTSACSGLRSPNSS